MSLLTDYFHFEAIALIVHLKCKCVIIISKSIAFYGELEALKGTYTA